MNLHKNARPLTSRSVVRSPIPEIMRGLRRRFGWPWGARQRGLTECRACSRCGSTYAVGLPGSVTHLHGEAGWDPQSRLAGGPGTPPPALVCEARVRANASRVARAMAGRRAEAPSARRSRSCSRSRGCTSQRGGGSLVARRAPRPVAEVAEAPPTTRRVSPCRQASHRRAAAPASKSVCALAASACR